MGKTIYFLLGVYVLSFIIILLLGFVDNIYLRSGLGALGVAVIVFMLVYRKEVKFSGGNLRYSMLCNKCHWEWMSNVTEEKPRKCPSCSNVNLEVLGWRKVVNIPKKKDKELDVYFK
tara:strand:+ start:57 stop:407 length:351 start_codon:yes stop_codon:yes gene_type:complete